MEHKGTKIIETERLILRPFRTEDAEPMFRNWASDPEVTKFLTWPTHESVEVSKGVVGSWCEKNNTFLSEFCIGKNGVRFARWGGHGGVKDDTDRDS